MNYILFKKAPYIISIWRKISYDKPLLKKPVIKFGSIRQIILNYEKSILTAVNYRITKKIQIAVKNENIKRIEFNQLKWTIWYKQKNQNIVYLYESKLSVY